MTQRMDLVERVDASQFPPEDVGRVERTLSLPFDQRQKSRLLAVLDDGTEAGVILARGTVLRDGDLLRATDGTWVRVVAAPETVSTVALADGHLLTRVAYHLGNRHVPLQVEPGRLRYLHDHVLDAMVQQLGARVTVDTAPFEPEAGAYHSSAHSHGHSHGGSHGHSHGHGHGHSH